jgi:hypothetical protein
MACPRCRAVQPAAEECRYCGVVLHKARTRPQPVRPKHAAERGAAAGALPSGAKWARWSHRLGDALLGYLVSLALALVAAWGLLHLMRAMWSIYIATPVGHQYLSMEGPHAATLQYLANMDLLTVAVLVTLCAAVVTLASGAMTQLLHLRRIFHEPFGWLANLFVWVAPLTATTGWLLHRQDALIQWGVAYVLSFLPTLLLYNRGLDLAKAAVPELATLLGTLAGFGRRREWPKRHEGRHRPGSAGHP